MWMQFKLKDLFLIVTKIDEGEESIVAPFVTQIKCLSLCPTLAGKLAHKKVRICFPKNESTHFFISCPKNTKSLKKIDF